MLYYLRKVSSVNEFTSWATDKWPILTAIGALALFASGWVIKHNFKPAEQQKRVSNTEIANIIEKESVITLVAWGIGISGFRGYPKEPDKAWWLNLEVSANLGGKPIDKLDLVIEEERPIHAHNWTRRVEAHFNPYFDITEWRHKGIHQVELIAYTGIECLGQLGNL